MTGTAREIAARVSRREASAREECRAALDRIARGNPVLNAIVTMRGETSLAEAATVDRRLAAGEKLPLAGVPYTLKDNLWAAGWRASQGSRLFADFVAPRDCGAVSRLRAAGAVLVGITNCSEFACKGVTTNRLYGPTRNPWDLALTPGGSSGGAAAATAARLTPFAIATDAGGSTRRPAAHTGLVGMKPSLGRVPNADGFPEPNLGISVVGVLATDVADAALVLETITAYDPRDPFSVPSLPVAAKPRPRIAWSADLGCGFAIDADVRAALESLVERLARDGGAIERADPEWPPGTGEYPLLAVQQAGLATLFGETLATRRDELDPDIAAQIELGMRLSGAEIARALLRREAIAAALAGFFERYDLLLCPTAPVTAWPLDLLGPPEIGGRPAGPRGHAAFTPLVNYCGVPAVSVPAGLVRGLPIGLQVVGPRHADAAVLELAAVVEGCVPKLPPPPWGRG